MIKRSNLGMKEILQQMKDELLQRIMDEVPEYGDFETVEVFASIQGKGTKTDCIALELMQPPIGIIDRDTKRGLKIVAYNDEDGLEILIASGTKQELLEKLREQDILLELEECFIKLENCI